MPLFKDYRVAKGRYENSEQYNVLCPYCGAITLTDDWQEESECNECAYEFVSAEGNVTRGGYYNCPDCGQKEAITEAISQQGKPEMRLYAVEYYCADCDDAGKQKSSYKGCKPAEEADKLLFEEAKGEWESRTDLHEYVPNEEIPEGAITAASSVSGNDVYQHGYEDWISFFNERQLLFLSKLLRRISNISNQNAMEHFLLAFSDSLRTNTK